MIESMQHKAPAVVTSINATIRGLLKQKGFADFLLSGTSLQEALAARRDISQFQNPYDKHVWVYALARKHAEAIKGVPFSLFEGEMSDETRRRPLRPNHPLVRLMDRPNPMHNQTQFIEQYFLFIVLRGDVIVTKETFESGSLPQELWIQDPRWFKPVVDEETKLVTGWFFRSRKDVSPIFFSSEEVIYDRIINPNDPIRGLGPMGPGNQPTLMDLAAARANEAFFTNGAEPGVILSTEQPMDELERETYQAAWDARYQGPGKSHRTAVLGGGLKPVPLGMDHTKMQFLEQRQFHQDELLVAFNTPRSVISRINSKGALISNDQAREELKVWWTTNLIPKMVSFEWAFWEQCFRQFGDNIFGLFDVSSIEALREDFSMQVEIGTKLFALGYPANAINQRLNLGMPDVPWGNTGFLGSSLLEVGDMPRQTRNQRMIRSLGKIPIQNQASWTLDTNDKTEKVDHVTPSRQFSIRELSDASTKRGIVHRHLLWQREIRGVERIEGLMAKMLRRFFFNIRSQALEDLFQADQQDIGKGDIPKILTSIDSNANRRIIIEQSQPFIQDATQRALNRLGEVGINLEIDDPTISRFQKAREPEIQKVLTTIRQAVNVQVVAGIEAAETTSEIAQRIRSVFNAANNRAFNIARTEVGIASDGAFFEGAKSEGIEEHEWLSQGDGVVRESHQIDGQKRRIGDAFSNGLMYPHDAGGPPEEIINCRCIALLIVT